MGDITQILQRFTKDLGRPYPARDWLIICAIAGTVGVLGCALAIYMFLGVQTGSIVSGGTEVPRAPIPVSRDAIKTVLETYQARASNYASKTFAPVDLVDPRPRSTKK